MFAREFSESSDRGWRLRERRANRPDTGDIDGHPSLSTLRAARAHRTVRPDGLRRRGVEADRRALLSRLEKFARELVAHSRLCRRLRDDTETAAVEWWREYDQENPYWRLSAEEREERERLDAVMERIVAEHTADEPVVGDELDAEFDTLDLGAESVRTQPTTADADTATDTRPDRPRRS